MSDPSEDTKSDTNNKEERFCRDFIRGVCDRKFCKYKHENEPKMLNFCHDFQNNICPRQNCKFIHCTADEEMEYKKRGLMSNHMMAEANRKNQLPGGLPICNQYRKGMCKRNFCKYRHLNKDEEDTEVMEMIQNNCSRKNVITMNMIEPPHKRNLISFDDYDDCGMTVPKRRFLHQEPELLTNNDVLLEANRGNRGAFKGYFAGTPPAPMLNRADARTLMMEDEINLLHKEIAQLKRQVSDLTATNEFLLDQNANLRVSGKRNDSVNMPSVTITNTNSPQVIRTVTASVATVPVSLATVSTCNPVSVSIAGCPAVSMAPPAQLLAPSQQILVTTNPSTQLAIANSSQAQAQLAIAQQNLANNLAQQAQPQLTSQAQQLALATTTQQLALASNPQQPQQLTLTNTQTTHQQLNQQLTSQAQQLATQQQLTSQAQQLALANTQQLTSQAQQLALANTQQLTSQAQQLAMANSNQHLTVTNVPQQLTLAGQNQQLLAQQNQQMEMHRNNQINAINTSQAIAMSNASQPMVSYPIMTQSINHALTH